MTTYQTLLAAGTTSCPKIDVRIYGFATAQLYQAASTYAATNAWSSDGAQAEWKVTMDTTYANAANAATATITYGMGIGITATAAPAGAYLW